MPAGRTEAVFVDDRAGRFRVIRQRATVESRRKPVRGIVLSAMPVLVAVVGAASIVLPFVGVLVDAASPRKFSRDAATIVAVVIAIGLLIACTAGVCWLTRVILREWFRRLDWELLSSRRHAGACGACGFHLAGLPVEPDGCVKCPECAHAWRAASPPPQS